MPSISENLQHVKDFQLQKALKNMFTDLAVAAPSALTAATPAAITALAPPAGGTGATAGAYDTANNRDLMITSVTALRTDLTATRAEVAKLVTDITALRATVAGLTVVTA